MILIDMKKMINTRFVEAVEFVISGTDGCNKSKMAVVLDLKPSTFSEILKKRTNVSAEMISLFCFHYNVSVEWIMTGKGDIIKSEDIIENESELVKENYDLLRENRELLRQHIKSQNTIMTLKVKNQQLIGEIETLNALMKMPVENN